MTEWNIYLSLLLLIAIIIPPQKNMGVKGFMKNWDSHIEKPAKRLPPPKFIQIRYDIGKAPINIITYLSFLIDFADWLLCIVMLPCALILRDKSLDTAIQVYAIVYMAMNLPIGIAETVCELKISKKQGIKINSEKYVAARALAETFARKRSSEHREAMRKHKEYVNIIAPFLKEFERYLDKKKGIRYMSEDKLEWVMDNIFSKYQKKLSYSISSEDPQHRLLTIRLIRNDQVIIQVPVKKL